MKGPGTLSLRTRLTLWYSLAIVVVLSLFAADLAFVQERLGIRSIDRELMGVTTTLATVLRDEFEEQKDLAPAAEEARRTVAGLGQAVAIIDDRGVPVAATWNGLDLHGQWPAAADGPRSWTVQMPSGAWRVHAQPEMVGATTF